MRSVALMQIPCGFKIRRKIDVEKFINDCMCNDNRYSITVNRNEEIIIEKDKNSNISVAIRNGDLFDIFNPEVEVARTKDNCYDKTVQDYIWKYRKSINKKWFNN